MDPTLLNDDDDDDDPMMSTYKKLVKLNKFYKAIDYNDLIEKNKDYDITEYYNSLSEEQLEELDIVYNNFNIYDFIQILSTNPIFYTSYMFFIVNNKMNYDYMKLTIFFHYKDLLNLNTDECNSYKFDLCYDDSNKDINIIVQILRKILSIINLNIDIVFDIIKNSNDELPKTEVDKKENGELPKTEVDKKENGELPKKEEDYFLNVSKTDSLPLNVDNNLNEYIKLLNLVNKYKYTSNSLIINKDKINDNVSNSINSILSQILVDIDSKPINKTKLNLFDLTAYIFCNPALFISYFLFNKDKINDTIFSKVNVKSNGKKVIIDYNDTIINNNDTKSIDNNLPNFYDNGLFIYDMSYMNKLSDKENIICFLSELYNFIYNKINNKINNKSFNKVDKVDKDNIVDSIINATKETHNNKVLEEVPKLVQVVPKVLEVNNNYIDILFNEIMDEDYNKSTINKDSLNTLKQDINNLKVKDKIIKRFYKELSLNNLNDEEKILICKYISNF